MVENINQILPDGPARDQMIAGLVDVKAKLRGPGSQQIQPADRAAAEIIGALNSLRNHVGTAANLAVQAEQAPLHREAYTCANSL